VVEGAEKEGSVLVAGGEGGLGGEGGGGVRAGGGNGRRDVVRELVRKGGRREKKKKEKGKGREHEEKDGRWRRRRIMEDVT